MSVKIELQIAWWKIKHPITIYQHWRKLRQYPHLEQCIYYHDTLVRVSQVSDGDDVRVRWYDEDDRHEEWVSWMHCCRLA